MIIRLENSPVTVQRYTSPEGVRLFFAGRVFTPDQAIEFAEAVLMLARGGAERGEDD